MRASKSDPQEYRAYNWEADLMGWAGPRAPLKKLRVVIERCCRAYRVPVPSIQFFTKDFRNGKRLMSYYDGNRREIGIRPRHRDVCTATHEAAHAIVDWILGNGIQTHGREWLGIHMALLARQKILPLPTLQHHAKKRRLKFYTPRVAAPENIRKHFPSRVRLACRERLAVR